MKSRKRGRKVRVKEKRRWSRRKREVTEDEERESTL